MGTLSEDLTAIKNVEDTLIANKVARFSYTDTAYAENDANGVDTFNINNEQNIPNPTASVMKVNPTILDYGYRAQASSITRMLVNHFFGRVSYNLNKINDNMSALIATLRSHTGTANGFATLDSDGHLAQQSPVGSPHVPLTNEFITSLLNRHFVNTCRAKIGSNSYIPNFFSFDDRVFISYSDGTTSGTRYSEDGKTFNLCKLSTDYVPDFYRLTTSGTVYVGITRNITGYSDNQLIYSIDDGENWSPSDASSVSIDNFISLQYQHGLFHVSTNTDCMWSENGQNWETCTGFVNGATVKQILYGNNKWVATTTQGIYFSIDGKQWQISNITSQVQSGLYFDNNIFLYAYNTTILWSEDGETWTASTGFSGTVASGNPLVYYDLEDIWYLASSGRLWKSENNGKTWSSTLILEKCDGVYYAKGSNKVIVYVCGTGDNNTKFWLIQMGNIYQIQNIYNSTLISARIEWHNGIFYLTGIVSTSQSSVSGIQYYSEDGIQWYPWNRVTNPSAGAVLLGEYKAKVYWYNHIILSSYTIYRTEDIKDTLLSNPSAFYLKNVPIVDA